MKLLNNMALFFIFLLLTGCQKSLLLNVKNEQKDESYNIQYSVIKDNNPPSSIGIGSIDRGESLSLREKFDTDSEVTLQAKKNSMIVWESPKYTMNKDRTGSLVIDKSKFEAVSYDPNTYMKELIAAEKEFRDEIPNPNELDTIISSLNGVFGAFIYKKNSDNDWTRLVAPETYNGGKKDLNWVQNNIGQSKTSITRNVMMNRSLTALVQGGYAIFVAKSGFTDSDLYEYSVNIEIVRLTHDDNPYSAMFKMEQSTDPTTISTLKLLKKYLKSKDYQVRFVNVLHLIKDFETKYKKYNRIATDSKLVAGSFIDGGHAYTSTGHYEIGSGKKNVVGGYEYETVSLIDDEDEGKKNDPVMEPGSVDNN